ncbi:MAG: hypothetical protein ABMA15_04845 [Vicinamibacterales bacterium]
MSKRLVGTCLTIVGLVCLAGVHAMRPPSGFMEALMMLGQGKQTFIREPLYQILLAGSALMSLGGIVLIVSGSAGERDAA